MTTMTFQDHKSGGTLLHTIIGETICLCCSNKYFLPYIVNEVPEKPSPSWESYNTKWFSYGLALKVLINNKNKTYKTAQKKTF